MADLKISEMTSASQINNDDNVELSQGNAQSGFASVKATILAIAQKIITGINFTSALETENKTIAGAINEVAQGGGGSSTFAGLSDVDIDDTTLANGQVPKWNSTTEKWENGNAGGGSGGHTILNDSGTSLAQEDDLQFKGTYVEDDQTNNKTVVNVIRQMTLAEFNQLTAEQKKGLIDVTDQQGHPITASDIPYDSNNTVKDKIDDVSNAVNSVSIVSETSVTTSINDTAYLYKLSNGVKVISYNSSSIQGTEHNNLFSIPTGYEPTVNKNHYFTGVTDNAKLRICKLLNGSVSVYAQEANDRGFYVSMIYS